MTNAPTQLKVKHYDRGWFAAAREIVEEAMKLLCPGAFKLFVHLSIHADAESGTVPINQRNLAKALQMSRRSVGTYLDQLEAGGVCRLRASPNQYEIGVAAITDRFWPYERHPTVSTSADGQSAYVVEVKAQFLARACVRSNFSREDERLAAQWAEEGIPLKRAAHAILLGCARKYMSWRDGHNGHPIASLKYFQPIVEELSKQEAGEEYWDYVRTRIERLEKLWSDSHSTKARRSRKLSEAMKENRMATADFSQGSDIHLTSGNGLFEGMS